MYAQIYMMIKIIEIFTNFRKYSEIRIVSLAVLYISEIIVCCWINKYSYEKFIQKKLRVDNTINQLQENDSI